MKKGRKRGKGMSEIEFEIVDDAVIKYTPMPEGKDIYKTEVVITKEIFQECYKRWVEPQESEGKE